MSEKEKSEIQKEKPKAVSRRNFLKMAGTTAAVGIAAAVPGAKKALSATPAKKLKMGAEEIYKSKKGVLKRFSEKNMAFKRVSEEYGKPWFKLWFKNMLGLVKKSKIGESVPVKSVKEARAHVALWVGASTWNKLSQPYGEGHENKGFLSWNPINVPPMFRGNPEPNPDPADLTKKVKQMARFFGANRVGIAKINRNWVYNEICRNEYFADAPITKKMVFRDVKIPNETETELIIPDTVKYAIVMILDLNRLATQIGPASVDTSAATNLAYSRMGITDIALSEAIRSMGYNALPGKNGLAMSIPLAIDAGLGQLGRNGLLITPDYGPAMRIGKVLTDMPLIPDKPIDFGVTEFCDKCKKCAEKCPAKAISFAERSYEPPVETGNPGSLKWYVNGKKCLRYWVQSGASCASCQAVCPYTKGSFWGHDVMRGLIKNVPALNPIWKPMDDMFGYGEIRSPELVWNMKMSPFGIDVDKEI